MDDNNKGGLQEANMVAAKLLGSEQVYFGGGMYLIDIENDATRMSVVEALGKKHGISIIYYCDQDGPHGWYYSEECGAQVYSTYTEAVAAALLAIVEEI